MSVNHMLYLQLLAANEGNEWVNPIFEEAKSSADAEFFTVEIEDFEQIEHAPEVRIYRIVKRADITTLHCRRV